MDLVESSVFVGERGEEFKELINDLLNQCHIEEKYMKKLLTQKSLSYFSTVFTHESADSLNNYIFFKSLGHSTVEKCLVWYIFKHNDKIKSKITQQLVTDIKRNIMEKNKLSTVYGDKITSKFITILQKLKEDPTKKDKIIHEIVEAFYGAIELIIDNEYEIGTGFEVVGKCIENALSEIDFEKEKEKDPKIVLNSIFNKYKSKIGSIEYVSEKNKDNKNVTDTVLYQKLGIKKFLISKGQAHNNKEAEKISAQKAILIFKQKGILTFDGNFMNFVF
jgi:dsRNA-specific ribonuclease